MAVGDAQLNTQSCRSEIKELHTDLTFNTLDWAYLLSSTLGLPRFGSCLQAHVVQNAVTGHNIGCDLPSSTYHTVGTLQ